MWRNKLRASGPRSRENPLSSVRQTGNFTALSSQLLTLPLVWTAQCVPRQCWMPSGGSGSLLKTDQMRGLVGPRRAAHWPSRFGWFTDCFRFCGLIVLQSDVEFHSLPWKTLGLIKPQNLALRVMNVIKGKEKDRAQWHVRYQWEKTQLTIRKMKCTRPTRSSLNLTSRKTSWPWRTVLATTVRPPS